MAQIGDGMIKNRCKLHHGPATMPLRLHSSTMQHQSDRSLNGHRRSNAINVIQSILICGFHHLVHLKLARGEVIVRDHLRCTREGERLFSVRRVEVLGSE